MALGPWGRRREEAEEPRELRFDCERCGAGLTFAPGTRQVACAHCGHVNAIPGEERAAGTAAPAEIDLRATLARLEAEVAHDSTRIVACRSCGAEFTLEADAHAGACPYCGSDVVTDTGRDRPIKPSALVPFAVDREGARRALRTWLGRRWFAPSDLARYARSGEGLTGLYTPYWTFDAETETRYVGDRGVVVHTARRMPRLGKGGPDLRPMKRSEIRWTRVSGRAARRFDDLLVVASRNLPQDLARALGSWRLQDLVPYREDYLAGFRSEAYQTELAEGFREAQQAMQERIEADVRAAIGGEMQRIRGIETRYGGLTFKHVLLPLWLAGYRYRGKLYQAVVNGQTGEVRGRRPYSPVKIGLAVLAGLVALGLLYLLFATQQGG